MAIQSSGAVSLSELATEFGGTAPHSMSEYYRDAGLVPGNNSGVPTSGAISLTDFYGSVAALVLEVSSNTTAYNVLTAAVAAGYNASTDTLPIIVNVAAGVTVSGTSSSVAGITTGALNANSDVTINIASTAEVCGFNGGVGGTGAAGGAGGPAIRFSVTGGQSTYTVVNNGVVGGGSGGGGGGGRAGTRSTQYYDNKYGGYYCAPPTFTGSKGANGASGTACRAQNGSSGSSGTYAGGSSGCTSTSAGSGGAGGAAGKAVEFGGLTVSVSGSGTVYGATS